MLSVDLGPEIEESRRVRTHHDFFERALPTRSPKPYRAFDQARTANLTPAMAAVSSTAAIPLS